MNAKQTCALALALVTLGGGPALAADFYVDPATGSMAGDGSAAAPWATLQEVLEAGLVETRAWEALPYVEGAALVPKNAGASVKAGDTIWLRDGYHGEPGFYDAHNAQHVTVAAQQGHTPRVSRLHFRGASRWTVRGLSISRSYAPDFSCADMVFVEDHGHRGPSWEVVVEGCELFSMTGEAGWSEADWNVQACNGVRLDGDDCVVRGNHLKNVNFGISVTGERALVERNVVENFAGDGLRGLGDHGVFQYNIVKNCYDVNANHDDGFQSWSVGADGQVGSGEVVGIVLRGNTFLNYEDPAQPFRGPLQGIGCFDGTFVDWVIESNVIITDHWHGITLLGSRGVRVINNTVLDINADEPGPPWIHLGPHKDGTPASGGLIRNNLATAIALDEGADVLADHNLILDDPAAHFVDVAHHDLHLRLGSAAIDAGSAELAPALDRDEIPRPQGAAVDLGAYEHYVGAPVFPDTAGPTPDAGGGGGEDSGGTKGGGLDATVGGEATPAVDSGGCASGGPAGGPSGLLALLLLGAAVLAARPRAGTCR